MMNRYLILFFILLTSFTLCASVLEKNDLIKEDLTQKILDIGSSSVERFSYIELLNQEVEFYLKTGKKKENLMSILKQSSKSLSLSETKISEHEILLVLIQMTKGS